MHVYVCVCWYARGPIAPTPALPWVVVGKKGGCSFKTPLKLWPNQLAPRAGLLQLPDRQTDPQVYSCLILPPPSPSHKHRAWPCPCKDPFPCFSPRAEIKQVRLQFKKSVDCSRPSLLLSSLPGPFTSLTHTFPLSDTHVISHTQPYADIL